MHLMWFIWNMLYILYYVYSTSQKREKEKSVSYILRETATQLGPEIKQLQMELELEQRDDWKTRFLL